MPNACALNGSADKLGLTDAVGRKAGCKVGVFFLGHAGLDNTAAVRRVVLFAGHGLHLLSLIAVFGANLHPITGSNSQGFSRAESPLLYNFCFTDCLTFSALALCPQFTDAAFHRMVCDGCYHARTIPDGEQLPSAVIAHRERPGFPEAGVSRSLPRGRSWRTLRFGYHRELVV